MQSKKWIMIFLIFSSLTLGFVGLVNYVVDPFNVFHTRYFKKQSQMNERFMKIEFLDKNHKNYNSYIFGSSRIGTTYPSIVETYIPDSKFYNFSIALANMYDHLMHLKYFLHAGYNVKNLYLQIDIDNMASYGPRENDYMRKIHPNVLGNSLNTFYLQYLTGIFPSNIKSKIEKNLNVHEKEEYFLETTGMWLRPDKDKKVLENCNEYIKNEPTFITSNDRRYIKSVEVDKTIEDLKEIIDICKKNKINLMIFVTPHHKNMMNAYSDNDYFEFLKKLSSVTDYFDFSGYNSVTTNSCNYYESSHYRSLVGDLIAAKIFGNKLVELPEDFGFLVTKNNVHEHIKNLKLQIYNNDYIQMKGYYGE